MPTIVTWKILAGRLYPGIHVRQRRLYNQAGTGGYGINYVGTHDLGYLILSTTVSRVELRAYDNHIIYAGTHNQTKCVNIYYIRAKGNRALQMTLSFFVGTRWLIVLYKNTITY